MQSLPTTRTYDHASEFAPRRPARVLTLPGKAKLTGELRPHTASRNHLSSSGEDMVSKIGWTSRCFAIAVVVLSATAARAQATAGYSEYLPSGDELKMYYVSLMNKRARVSQIRTSLWLSHRSPAGSRRATMSFARSSRARHIDELIRVWPDRARRPVRAAWRVVLRARGRGVTEVRPINSI